MAAVRNGILARMQKATLIALAAALAAALPAAETNVVDAVALGKIGTGTSADGWLVGGVTNYAASAHEALRLDTKDDFLVSPVFARPITRIIVKVKSSSPSGRQLAFTPLRDGAPVERLRRLCAHTATSSSFREQTIDWPYGARVGSFRMSLEGGEKGSKTNWGVWQMSVVAGDPATGTAVVVR